MLGIGSAYWLQSVKIVNDNPNVSCNHHLLFCLDKIECPSDCSQNCENTLGSYVCSCKSGWALESDGKVCTGKGVVVFSWHEMVFVVDGFTRII